MKQVFIAKTPLISEDDAPKLSQADFDRARSRVSGADACRSHWQTAVRASVGKSAAASAFCQRSPSYHH